MTIEQSDSPARAAATALTIALAESRGCCLLSGGSALDVYAALPAEPLRAVTFLLVDERWSRGAGNNYTQYAARFSEHPLFPNIIDSNVRAAESIEEFAERLTEAYHQAREHSEPIVALLGVGEDGHTAGIFPMPEATFTETYPNVDGYVATHIETLPEPDRVSLTPYALMQTDRIVAYAVGEKKQHILSTLRSQPVPQHTTPATLITEHPAALLVTDQLPAKV